MCFVKVDKENEVRGLIERLLSFYLPFFGVITYDFYVIFRILKRYKEDKLSKLEA